MKIMGYMGYRKNGYALVTKHYINNKEEAKSTPLENYNDKIKHSTDFEWGYYGSGPSQLSFCILYDYTNDFKFSSKHYQSFKEKYIGKFKEEWMITREEIRSFIMIVTIKEVNSDA